MIVLDVNVMCLTMLRNYIKLLSEDDSVWVIEKRIFFTIEKKQKYEL